MAETAVQQGVTGAEAIIGTLAECGVTACFANPGTSEMHLVTALDREPRIRSVLCLFEGVATGAADGFARMSGVPALTLLHLGPGYLNGGANIHNARRAYQPVVNLIGDHAVTHRAYDAPLASDIAGLARPNSRWLKSVDSVADAGVLAAEAFTASYGPPPGPVSLIMPADTAWTKGASIVRKAERPGLKAVAASVVEDAARVVKEAKKPTLLVNGTALQERGLGALARLSAAGVRVLSDTFMARHSRGGGRFAPERLPYFAEMAVDTLAGTDLLLIAGTKPPIAFFAYPNTPGEFTPKDAQTITLGGPDTDSAAALHALADALGAPAVSGTSAWARPEVPRDDKFNPFTIGLALAAHSSEGALISDDGVTAGLPIYLSMTNAAHHEWLGHTGGAIGQGMPVAVGAAIARPDVKTICLAGDGAGMYTVQSLWTMARENLDILTIVFVNNAYRILKIELARTGAGNPGPAANGMLSLGSPEIDWVKLAEGMGVGAEACSTLPQFNDALERAMAHRGPRLIAALVPGA
ncbi:MAG TPA: acetolactate synthase large subunit [Hyphomonadaceae bacterium]|nr:acetolactate synthase large subunit [Hyphomonadaceae bacterium]